MSPSNDTRGSIKFNTIKLSSMNKLEESNWIEYEYTMRFYLIYKELWYLLKDTEKKENGIEISEERRQKDVNALCAILLSSIHEDNISLIVMHTDPAKIWAELKHTHMNTSSGSKFYYLRLLMNTSYTNGEDIGTHLTTISKMATCLRKLCKKGMLSVDDIKNASVISSLPDKFSAVTTHFEQQDVIVNKHLTDAIRASVINTKNRNNSQGLASTEIAMKASGSASTSSHSNYKPSNKTSKPLPQCGHCKGVHKTTNCLKKQNETLAKQLESLSKKIDAMGGKAKFVTEENEDRLENESNSDYSESMARSAVAFQISSMNSKIRWNVDSGTTNSLVPTIQSMISPVSSSLTLRTASNEKIAALKRGQVPVPGLSDVTAHQIVGLAKPLLSVADITDQDVAVTFLKDKVLFTNQPMQLEKSINESNTILAQGSRFKRSYYLDTEEVSSYRASQVYATNMLTWHLRLGHLSLRSLQDLRRRGEIEVSKDDSQRVMECEDCMKGKFNRLNMKSRELHRVSRKLECVHSDLCQLPVKSQSGSKYMMTFLDEYKNMGVVYFLKFKSQAFSCFKHYVKWSERQTQEKLRKIRTDNGGEYTSEEWAMYCRESGIHHSMGPPHSPQLNGKAERFNRTILDRILPTLFHSNLPTRLWEDSARNSLTGLNASPSRTNPGSSSPISMWEGKAASYSRLRTFGCNCWRMITGPTKGGKLSARSSTCLYLYTLPDGDGWMVWDKALSRAVKSHDVLFIED